MLACQRHVVPLLLQGVIAEELGLSKEICNQFVGSAIQILNERRESGRLLAYSHLTWKELLQRLSQNGIESPPIPDGYESGVAGSGWLGYEGASEESIEAAEARLGLQLPKDYKDFLRVSNGFREFPLSYPAILPVGKIDFLKNRIDQDDFDILANYPAPEDGDLTYADYLDRAVLISEEYDSVQLWLIAPESPDSDWQVWCHATWHPGPDAFPSFRFFIESQL